MANADRQKPDRSLDGEARASLPSATIDVRVRYTECDPMGVAHHSVFAVWFEMARTELLRQQGARYRDVEAEGVYFVVARLNVRFRKPARYDDALAVTVQAEPVGGIKLEHSYGVRREDGTLLATGETTLVCVDADGRPQPVPETVLPSQAREG
jgi:acyl-CoA thioester hydrolase